MGGDNLALLPHHSHKVIIAEEDKVIADLLSLALQEMGCQVRITAHEEKIRQGMIQWKPDLLILDLFLPGCSGLDLLRELKTMETRLKRSVPILVISAFGFREVVEMAKTLGAEDFILKPVDMEIFRQKVVTYLK